MRVFDTLGAPNLGSFGPNQFHNLKRITFNNFPYALLVHALAIDGSNELQQCILLGASYVQRVVHALNDHF